MQRQHGYSLIEVMVALLILAIGLTGLGIMQLITVQNTFNANNRAFAVMSAESMSDLVRSNLRSYELGMFVNQTNMLDVIDCSGGCNAAQTALNDIALWQLQLARNLPQGTGILCMDGSDGSISDGEPGAIACSGAGQNVIKIFWRENNPADAAGVNSISNGWSAFGTPLYP